MRFPIDSYFVAKLLLASVDLTIQLVIIFSVESITKLSIFCDVCLRDSNCLSSFQKRFVVCCLAVSSLMTNLNNESIRKKKRHHAVYKEGVC